MNDELIFKDEDEKPFGDSVEEEAGWKVLIVDDEDRGRLALKSALRNFIYKGRGLIFLEAWNYQSAKEVLDRDDDIDVVLLDIIMDSGAEGIQVLNHIRNVKNNHFIRVLVLTAHSRDYPEQKIRNDFEIDNFVSKAAGDLERGHIIMTMKNMLDIVNSFKIQRKMIEELNSVVAERTKDLHKLIQILCHDLANPLSIVITSSEWLSENLDKLDKENIDIRLKRIKKAGDIQWQIINHVKSLEYLNSLKSRIEFHPVCLGTIIRDALFVFQEKLEEKNIQLKCNFDELDTSWVYANQVVLSNQIVNNVISNAIKYSYQDGKILVSTHEDEGYICLEIRDFGFGISEFDMKNLFDLETKIQKKGTNGEEGTGFGLILIKSYTEFLKGEMIIESKTKDMTTSLSDVGTCICLKFRKHEF